MPFFIYSCEWLCAKRRCLLETACIQYRHPPTTFQSTNTSSTFSFPTLYSYQPSKSSSFLSQNSLCTNLSHSKVSSFSLFLSLRSCSLVDTHTPRHTWLEQSYTLHKLLLYPSTHTHSYISITFLFVFLFNFHPTLTTLASWLVQW